MTETQLRQKYIHHNQLGRLIRGRQRYLTIYLDDTAHFYEHNIYDL